MEVYVFQKQFQQLYRIRKKAKRKRGWSVGRSLVTFASVLSWRCGMAELREEVRVKVVETLKKKLKKKEENVKRFWSGAD